LVPATAIARRFGISEPTLYRWRDEFYRTSGGWLVKFELAGVRPDEIRLGIEGQSLILRGIRRDICIEEGQRSYSMEISYNEFERRMNFRCDLNRLEISTDHRDDMLFVRVNDEVLRR
jgi:HSP20 family protein